MDFHFFIRNAIAGGVMLGFMVLGVLLKGSVDLSVMFGATFSSSGVISSTWVKDHQTLTVAIITALSPLLGICLQGLYLFFLYFVRLLYKEFRGTKSREGKGLFNDPARVLLKMHMAPIISKHLCEKKGRVCGQNTEAVEQIDEQIARIKQIEPDSFFVCIYHSLAPVHLIEWARRRRSYHYLGWTCLMGSVLGFVAGWLLDGILTSAETNPYFTNWVIVAAVLAGTMTAYLAYEMKKDADDMEMVWAAISVDSDLHCVLLKAQNDKTSPNTSTKYGNASALSKNWNLV